MGKKEKTVEETYQKKTPIEHVLIRPDTYIGSVQPETRQMFVWNKETSKIEKKEITYVPGLYKIFDEIIVNAADNKTRDTTMTTIKVGVNQEKGEISVYNDGKGIPVVMHAKENVYVPELIFGHLLTSSNYDDTEKKITGGRNGYGAKLCNIFSTEFTIETNDRERMKHFKQTYRNNMLTKEEPVISRSSGVEYTKVTFKPDLAKFGMVRLDDELVSLLTRRVYDLAGTVGAVKVFFNEEEIKIASFREYIQLYFTEDVEIAYSTKGRWEIAFVLGDEQFQQVSFVNRISTPRGGTHVSHVADQIVAAVIEQAKKKEKGLEIRPIQVKSNIFLFLNCLIENASFDSQTKETLTLKASSFGSKCDLSPRFIAEVMKSGIVEKATTAARAKQSQQLKRTDGHKTSKLRGIPKLDDANNAGTKYAAQCTLILTEGDSAKALAVSGLSIIGRDNYGVFPLRGKLLNVREASHKQLMDNAEINSIKKIMGLQHGKHYANTTSLRYGHIMIMTDQDHDGSHIKGLIINMLEHFFPSLLQIAGFLQEFITPIVRVSKRSTVRDFFTIPEFESWSETQEGREKGWSVKYYKGLGTSTAKDAKQYFSNLDLHVKEFTVISDQDRERIELAFSKKRIESRKTWLREFVPGTHLDNRVSLISITDFINKELIHFSMADNTRSIPSIIDGLKPGQRKVLYCCFKRNLRSEIKVAQLAGYVAEHSAYHHGEQSLCMTIVNLAQDFVGSNNLPLLQPIGQFGTRLQGGKDAASARYIYTALDPITRYLFREEDDQLLNYLTDDNMKVEPDRYIPILPVVLMNGSEGIGTGWSTSIPCYNPREIAENIKRRIRDEAMEPMAPWYRGFVGEIEQLPEGRFKTIGEFEEEGKETINITELPIGTWTQNYKDFLETQLETGSIKDFREYNTDTKVFFELKVARANYDAEKRFKLASFVSTGNMVGFDAKGQLKKYQTVIEIMEEFFQIRKQAYIRRKDFLLQKLFSEMTILQNKVRFISEVVNGILVVVKRKSSELFQEMEEKAYHKKEASFEYLLSMQISTLTLERMERLQNEEKAKSQEYADLKDKTIEQLWLSDIDNFLAHIKDAPVEEIYPRGKKRKQRGKSAKAKAKAPPKPVPQSSNPWERYLVSEESDNSAPE
ncbi:DNA topoisomerase II [Nematocida displodere]|uniref:DNA topoisomerase 2 n=1 Tax=Nematocida displodere TaxID=1805483 RepID=A0A177EKD6_9MICR|nr:DNA topoisomerase II [Nematocida displodere]